MLRGTIATCVTAKVPIKMAVQSIELAIEIKKNALEVGFIENLFVFSSAEKERGAANVVDETGNALGMVVKGGDKGVRKKLR